MQQIHKKTTHLIVDVHLINPKHLVVHFSDPRNQIWVRTKTIKHKYVGEIIRFDFFLIGLL